MKRAGVEAVGASKRPRMTLEESRALVAAGQGDEEKPQTAMERMELVHRLFSTLCQRHRHANEACDDVHASPAIYMPCNMLDTAFPDWVERTLSASSDKEVAERGFYKALGVQQYQRFSDAIASAALSRSVFDPQRQLKCLYCDARAHDSNVPSANVPFLYTIAVERNARCCHPRTLEQKPSPHWAVDPTTNAHPFESSPIYGPDGKSFVGRSGTAICQLCLWTRQIARDADLMDALMTWSDFTRLVHQDWLRPMDANTRRICSCLYTAPGGDESTPPCGTICLFRLCRVVVTPDANGLVGHDSVQKYASWDTILAKRAEATALQRGYYTFDDPDLDHLSDMLMTGYLQRVMSGGAPPAAASTTPPPLPQAAMVNFDDPMACFTFMQQNKGLVDKFFRAMSTVTNYYGPSIYVARPLKSFGRLDCRACGHSGHFGQKKCPFVMGAIQERQVKGAGGQQARASLAEHILQNVETFGAEQRDSLLAIQTEHMWEINEIMTRVAELEERRRAGITTTLIPGPDPKFIGHNPSADQRRRSEAPRCTPLVPIKTLAACTLDMIMRGVNMDLFLDLQFLASLVLKMYQQDLDTTDVRHLIDWNQNLDPTLRNDIAHAAINLHAFVKAIAAANPPAVPKHSVEAILGPSYYAQLALPQQQQTLAPPVAAQKKKRGKKRVEEEVPMEAEGEEEDLLAAYDFTNLSPIDMSRYLHQ